MLTFQTISSCYVYRRILAVVMIFGSMLGMATEYPLTLEHKFGKSIIHEKPERVATVDWGGGDNLLALAISAGRWGARRFGRSASKRYT